MVIHSAATEEMSSVATEERSSGAEEMSSGAEEWSSVATEEMSSVARVIRVVCFLVQKYLSLLSAGRGGNRFSQPVLACDTACANLLLAC